MLVLTRQRLLEGLLLILIRGIIAYVDPLLSEYLSGWLICVNAQFNQIQFVAVIEFVCIGNDV